MWELLAPSRPRGCSEPELPRARLTVAESPHAGKGCLSSLCQHEDERVGTYFFLAPLALAFFCGARLLVAFLDFLAMMFIFLSMVYSPTALPVSPKGTSLWFFMPSFATVRRKFVGGWEHVGSITNVVSRPTGAPTSVDFV